jgi:hypothetical protein
LSMFRRRVPHHYIPIHPDNLAKNDWIIVLEAGTIVGPSPDKLRVARATLERKIVKKHNILLRPKHYLVVDGYDPRIHALYFCPQLYKSDSDGNLVALEGEEIGTLLAKIVQGAVVQKQPWYDPAEKSPNKPIISAAPLADLDSIVVDSPARKPLELAFSRAPTAQEDAREFPAPEDTLQPAAPAERSGTSAAASAIDCPDDKSGTSQTAPRA